MTRTASGDVADAADADQERRDDRRERNETELEVAVVRCRDQGARPVLSARRRRAMSLRRGHSATTRRRFICCKSGRLTSEARRSFAIPRITSAEMSSWPGSRPWIAEAGKAWCPLCHDSPNDGIASSRTLRLSSRVRKG